MSEKASENPPLTFEDAIAIIGNNCNHQKIADLILSGILEAYFRYDGIIGIMNEFIPFIHNDMDSLMLKNELIDTKIFRGWLLIDKHSKGFHELLYKKLTSIKIKNAFSKHALSSESPKHICILLDEDIEFYELYGNIDHPKILSYQLTFDELRISIESLNKYIDDQNTKEDINISLLNEIEILKKEIATLKADLIKGKSKKTYNQLIYALLNYARLDISHPYSIYHLLAKHCDEQKEVIPIPTNEVFADYVQKAVYEFNNRDPK